MMMRSLVAATAVAFFVGFGGVGSALAASFSVDVEITGSRGPGVPAVGFYADAGSFSVDDADITLNPNGLLPTVDFQLTLGAFSWTQGVGDDVEAQFLSGQVSWLDVFISREISDSPLFGNSSLDMYLSDINVWFYDELGDGFDQGDGLAFGTFTVSRAAGNPIPEPTAALLFGTGFGVVGLAARRSRGH